MTTKIETKNLNFFYGDHQALFDNTLEPVDLSLMEWAWQSPLLVTQVPRH